MKLFEYAAIKHPTEKEEEDGKKSELVVPVTTVLATDDKGAAVHAARAIPAEHVDDIDRIEVVVRPF